MEMFLFAVYAISAVAVAAVLLGVKAGELKAAVEKGMVQAAIEEGYLGVDEMPGYITTTARVVAWSLIIALPVIPVLNTVLTLRLARKVYRRMIVG